MLIALILFALACITLTVLTIYIISYRRQIADITNQLKFITTHDSFKFIHTQIKPKEIAAFVDTSNTLLRKQRELNQEFITKSEEINATIAHLSHDIRTPITSLDGYLQLAQRSDDLEKKTQYIQLAQTRIKQINTLVDELFLYTKLQHPDHILELESIDVINVLKKHLFTFIDAFSRKSIEPEVDLPDEPVHIRGNEQALERICENIIRNYFIHGEGTLTIRYEEVGETVFLYFSNALNRNSELDLDVLFNRFYKGDSSRTKDSSGLGLSIVQSLVEKMHGSVYANIKDGTFTIRIGLQKVKKGYSYGN